jgi:cell division septum initiation protein DivIVA
MSALEGRYDARPASLYASPIYGPNAPVWVQHAQHVIIVCMSTSLSQGADEMYGRLLLEVGQKGARRWAEREIVLQGGILRDATPDATPFEMPVAGAALRNPKTPRGLASFRLEQRGQKLILAAHTLDSLREWVAALQANGARSSFEPPACSLLPSDPPELAKAKAVAERVVAEAKAAAERDVAEVKAASERAIAEAKADAERTVAEAKAEAGMRAREQQLKADAELARAKVEAQAQVAKVKADVEAEMSKAQVTMEKAGQMIGKAVAAAEPATVQLATGPKLPPIAVDGETASDKWSLLSWAEGAAIHRIVAAAIRQPLVDEGLGEDPDAALGLLRGIKDRAALAKLLRTEAMIEGMIDLVWAETEALQRAGAATSGEIQSKFAGAIELSYGGLDKFFGGLEAIVGGPNPKLLEGMEGEHLNGPGTESTDTFTPGNYGITTSSLIEWKFIVDEEATPKQVGLDRWPEESVEKLPDRSLCRKHRPLADIKKEAEYRNEQLAKGKNSGLGVEELIAAVSYTGPVMPSSQCCPLVSYFPIGPP